MDDIKEKILTVIKTPQIMALATVTEDGKPWVRYVMGFGADDLTIRFVTSLQTRKVAQIKNNPEVHLTCGASSSSLQETECYLQISGKAEVTTDETERNLCWNDQLKAYFSGPDDPAFCVVIVKPYRIEYSTMTEMAPKVWEAD
ncbi:pyridoxamine 5'-phosphate oxidase family protein [Acidobacteriota bacterium]